MYKTKLGKLIYNTSYLQGNFKLRSGQISHEYFDKYLFESDPYILSEIAEHLQRLIPSDTEVLAGLEMGGIPIATALSLKTGIPVIFVRKKNKEYGTCKFAEGIDIKDKRVCVIEDVVTTGGQIILSTNDLRGIGAKVENVLCVIERSVKGRDNLKDNGLELSPLFTMDELKKQVEEKEEK